VFDLLFLGQHFFMLGEGDGQDTILKGCRYIIFLYGLRQVERAAERSMPAFPVMVMVIFRFVYRIPFSTDG
jgi:hypothetical protein